MCRFSIDRAEFAITPVLGVMIVSLDNFAEDDSQALLLPLFDRD